MNTTFGAQVRLRRLFRVGDGKLLMVPLDHPVSDGPVIPGRGMDRLVGRLAEGGADAVVLHRGAVRHVQHQWFAETSLVVHLSASTVQAPDPDAKYLVCSVETAVRLGADAVSVHVNLGSDGERQQVADLAAVADGCDRWGIPLVAMMYPRGPRIADPYDPALIAHAARLAADLGADVVKTLHPATVAELADIAADCPVPILVAGGPRRDDPDAVVDFTRQALRAGAAGVAMGRNIFQAAHPSALVSRLADVVHPAAGVAREHQRDLAAAHA